MVHKLIFGVDDDVGNVVRKTISSSDALFGRHPKVEVGYTKSLKAKIMNITGFYVRESSVHAPCILAAR